MKFTTILLAFHKRIDYKYLLLFTVGTFIFTVVYHVLFSTDPFYIDFIIYFSMMYIFCGHQLALKFIELWSYMIVYKKEPDNF